MVEKHISLGLIIGAIIKDIFAKTLDNVLHLAFYPYPRDSLIARPESVTRMKIDNFVNSDVREEGGVEVFMHIKPIKDRKHLSDLREPPSTERSD